MILMLEVTHGQVVLGVGTPLDWVAKEDPIGWMLGMTFIKFLMLKKKQCLMKYKLTYQHIVNTLISQLYCCCR